jgi:hypothetical protein
LKRKKESKKIVLRERKRQFENEDRVTRTMLVPPLFALKIHLQVRSFILFFRKKITLSSCRGQAQECKENVVANYSD